MISKTAKMRKCNGSEDVLPSIVPNYVCKVNKKSAHLQIFLKNNGIVIENNGFIIKIDKYDKYK